MSRTSGGTAFDPATLDFEEVHGYLPDGTEYLFRVPAKWEGGLVRDLDFAMGVHNPDRVSRYNDLLRRGFAVSGTARHRLRQWQYDPRKEIANHERLLDMFEARWGKPETVLQFGCSGGGHLALAVAESFHERVDGAVALAAHTPIWLMNGFLDGWFALKVLLEELYVEAGYGPAEDLSIISLPNDGSSDPTGHGMAGKLPEAWRKAFTLAHSSREGRARLALAFTLGQWSPWMADNTSLPDLDDVEALQEAIYEAAMRLSQSPGGEARIIFENAASGQQLSWNDSVDYAAFFETGNAALKAATETLYAQSGGDLAADLRKINEAPRIEASSYAIDFWSQPGRTVFGKPKIPVMRLHMVGDYQIPYTQMQGYEMLVEENGHGDNLRTALVKSTGHCNFLAGETATAVETVMQRIKTGTWPDTDPESLNSVGTALDTGEDPRFMARDGFDVPSYNRIWVKPGAVD